jgi:hypothetical protein
VAIGRRLTGNLKGRRHGRKLKARTTVPLQAESLHHDIERR